MKLIPPWLCEVVLVLLFGVLLFAFGFLVGAGHGIDLIRQQAVDEGYGVREGADETFRWRSGEELRRRPAKRD